ncbi:radical SAM protein [Candidatus Woesearchaeota archaeon]|nr:radical SAM protein [Candidatus Woesearchaeota archaeon]
MRQTWFERAIFLSWYCSTPDCKFCYMSTMKGRIKDPKKARRSLASVLAEAFIAKKLGWKIEFITAGTKSFSDDEMLTVLKSISEITQEKHFLNFGALTESQIKLFQPYIKGYCGTVECINLEKRREICPSKPIEPIISSFKIAEKHNLERAMTIVIGIGETEDDIPLLVNFIREHKITKLIIYALNPIKGTSYKKGPEKEYYLKWIREIRNAYPELYIVAGMGSSRTGILHNLLDAGATSFTKFPAIKFFNSEKAEEIEHECRIAGYSLNSSMSGLPEFSFEEIDMLNVDSNLKNQIKGKIQSYSLPMKSPSCKDLSREATQQL